MKHPTSPKVWADVLAQCRFAGKWPRLGEIAVNFACWLVWSNTGNICRPTASRFKMMIGSECLSKFASDVGIHKQTCNYMSMKICANEFHYVFIQLYI